MSGLEEKGVRYWGCGERERGMREPIWNYKANGRSAGTQGDKGRRSGERSGRGRIWRGPMTSSANVGRTALGSQQPAVVVTKLVLPDEDLPRAA